MNAKLNTLMLICTPLALNAAANAASPTLAEQKLTAALSLGALSGETKERVYDPAMGGHKNSQLNWKYRNAAIINGALDWDVLPQLTLGASGWTTLGSRGGNMEDYDWMDPAQAKWTDRSSHPDTRLNFANNFDLSVKGWLLNTPERRLGLMAGYQESRYSFNARGGSYNYDNGTDIGEFPADEIGIGYKQRYKVPYIGLLGQYRYRNVEVGGAFKYSGWVRSSDTDEHYSAAETFNSKIHNQNYFSVAANVGYYLTERAKIVVEGSWNRVTNKKGSLTTYDHDDNTVETEQGASGIENYSFVTRVGVHYTF